MGFWLSGQDTINRYPQYGSPLLKGSCQRLRGFIQLQEAFKSYPLPYRFRLPGGKHTGLLPPA
jgi:hypothetical protein